MKIYEILLFCILLFTVLIPITYGAESVVPYWIDHDNKIWVPVTVNAHSTVTINITKTDGYTPNGSSVFPTFFEDFTNTSSVQYDGIVTQLTGLPTGAADVPLVTYNGNIYCFGGYGTSSAQSLNNTQIYNIAGNSWSSGQNMIISVWGATTCLYGDKVYLFGGSNDSGGTSYVPYLQIYNITANTWAIDPTQMPANLGKQGLMSASDGTYAYILLGNVFYKYSYADGTYTQLANCPSKVSWGDFAYYPATNRMYLIGGNNLTTSACDANVSYYDIDTNTWSGKISTSPYAVYGQTRENTIYGDKMFEGWGQGPSTWFHSEMYYYNITTNTWSPRISLGIHPRDGVGTAIVGSDLYCIGGRDTSSSTHGETFNEKVNLFNLTANAHIVPSTDIWNYSMNTGQMDIKNGVLNITGAPVVSYNNAMQLLYTKNAYSTGNTLTMYSNIQPSNVSGAFKEIGWYDNIYANGVTNANDLYASNNNYYLQGGYGNGTYDLHNIGITWFNAWHTYDITRTGAKGTHFIMDGSTRYNSTNDTLNNRVVAMRVRQPNGAMYIDYMFLHQYAETQPTYQLTENEDVYLLTVTNPSDTNLINYQLDLTGLGIESQAESWYVYTGYNEPESSAEVLGVGDNNNFSNIGVSWNPIVLLLIIVPFVIFAVVIFAFFTGHIKIGVELLITGGIVIILLLIFTKIIYSMDM